MKILHVAKFYPPAHGGIETAVASMAEGVAALGHSVHVLAHVEDGQPRVDHPGVGVTVERLGYPAAIGTMPLAPRLFSRYWALRDWADVVHFHEPFPPASLLNFLVPAHKPIFVSWHSDIVRQKIMRHVVAPLQAKLCKDAHTIVCSAPFVRDHSVFLPPYRDKTMILPFGIDLAPLAAASGDDAMIAATRRERGGRFVLAAGRMVYYKGFGVLLDALKQCDARLVLIGEGPMRAEWQEQANQLGLGDRVQFLGGVDAATLHRHYAACELFVLPSTHRAETFAIVQIEAMACGKPVINTALPTGVPEVSLDGVTGLTVAPGDVSALAGALQHLWQDDGLRQNFGTAARKRAFEYYALEPVSRRLEQAYRAACVPPRAG